MAETAGICSDLLLWHQRGHRLRKSISIFSAVASRRANRVFCQCRELEVQLKEQIIAYGQAQAEASHGEQPIGIWVGGDETFMACPFSWPWN